MFILSVIVISIIGTLLHFLYDFSNHNKIVGLFAAVNESTWEHIKMALTALFLWGLVDGLIYGHNPNYFLAKSLSVLMVIIIMPVLYYGQKIVSKKECFIFNILIFYLSIICGQLGFYYIINLKPIGFFYRYLSCIILLIIFASYLLLTLLPIKNLIFKDPITKKYGFKGHSLK